MAKKPTSLSIRTYQVGFGDCFLLTFGYTGGSKKHVLIDFGTTATPEGTKKAEHMLAVANDIKKHTGGKLHAVVATHRHKDHIDGFATKNGKGPGDIIRSLAPDFVVQPWTEKPDEARESTGPAASVEGKQHIAALADMHSIASYSLGFARHTRDPALKKQLGFIGEDNIGNANAVKNLMQMGAGKKGVYVYAGADAKFDTPLGIKVHVLGPPTIKQWKGVTKQKSRDANEYWHFQARSLAAAAPGGGRKVTAAAPLFGRYIESRKPPFRVNARWMIYRLRAMQGEQMLQIVRRLDDAMNNTSVILLFEVGKKFLLFPGDAQIENWQYALSQDKMKKLLAGVDLYKVGHHGSLNATPKTLWGLFDNRSSKPNSTRRMAALLSTMSGEHGNEDKDTEVPRRTLVAALKKDTKLFSTEGLTDLSSDIEVNLD